MKLHEVKKRTAEPGKSEPQNRRIFRLGGSNIEGWNRFAQAFLK
jgi:hypothetical protein